WPVRNNCHHGIDFSAWQIPLTGQAPTGRAPIRWLRLAAEIYGTTASLLSTRYPGALAAAMRSTCSRCAAVGTDPRSTTVLVSANVSTLMAEASIDLSASSAVLI